MLPDADPSLRLRKVFSRYRQLFMPTLRMVLISIIVSSWTWLLYSDYVANNLDLKIKTKLIGVLMIIAIFSEYSLISHRITFQRRLLNLDLSDGYMCSWGRMILGKESLAHFTLVYNIDQSLTWAQTGQWWLLQRRHFFADYIIYPMQLLAIFALAVASALVELWYQYYYYCEGMYEQLLDYDSVIHNLGANETLSSHYRTMFSYITCADYQSSFVNDTPSLKHFEELWSIYVFYMTLCGISIFMGIVSSFFNTRYVKRYTRNFCGLNGLAKDIGQIIRKQLKGLPSSQELQQ